MSTHESATSSSPARLFSHSLGFPRIGSRRELKKAVEAYWKGASDETALQATARELRATHWQLQADAGIDLIPSNDFSLYDQVLDTSCLVGNVPARFGWDGKGDVTLETYFAMARGRTASKEETAHEGSHCDRGNGHGGNGAGASTGAAACEMTKWFDTNYHYLVPEFNEGTKFRLASQKPFTEFQEALALGHRTKPVLLGPISYLYLGKLHGGKDASFDCLKLLPQLLAVYGEVLQTLAAQGAEWVQLDEPIFALDLDVTIKQHFTAAYDVLREKAGALKLITACYFGAAGANFLALSRLPVEAIHLDVTRGASDLDHGLEVLPPRTIVSLGIVDGRNIWKNDFAASLKVIDQVVAKLGRDRVWLAPSCSLQHSPVSLRHETKLEPAIKDWMSFAEEKLTEVTSLARLAVSATRETDAAWIANQHSLATKAADPRLQVAAVRHRAAGLTSKDEQRHSSFAQRQGVQRARLKLPAFPTTTIGSFPQTDEVRSWRARWRKGTLTDAEYEALLGEETARCVRVQEELGIDVLVHGEFERNDMVEYFGEQLDGFTFTQNGWVQSYGSRCVKPPVIFGDVARPHPMTVRWFQYAQSLTSRLMKGMLTGPITILNWSFVRNDLPRHEVCRQIALAIRDEVRDLEAAGCRVIQIDEAALRECLPLREKDRAFYLEWTVAAFRVAASVVRDETQIHTHMCYSNFNDIIEAIAAMDADVITIETSRSSMELLDAFVRFQYPNEIGPGVYDIHSPRVPPAAEIRELMDRASAVLPKENLWVNPDCGLKTRGWPEVKAALANMVAVAQELRRGGNSDPA